MQQDLGVGKRRVGMREGNAAGFGQFGHFGEGFALEFLRHRADRIDARAGQVPGAELEHFHQARLVERRVGVGREGQRGDAAACRGEHFRFQRGLVFEAGLAQTHGKVDQAGAHHAIRRVDGLVGVEAVRGLADGGDLAGDDEDVRGLIDAVGGVDEAPVLDVNLHAVGPISIDITAMRTAMP